MTSTPASLRQALLDTAVVSAADLAALDAWGPYRGLSLVERLYRSGLVSDVKLVEVFARLGAVDASATVLRGLPPPAALGAFSRALAERHRALPLAVEKRRLVVALLDPSDTTTLEKLSFTCGLVVEPRACRPRVLFEALGRAYDIPVVRPEASFLEARRLATTTLSTEDVSGDLPPPSPDVPVRVVTRPPRSAEPHSPIANALAAAVAVVTGDAVEIDLDSGEHEIPSLYARSARDLRPASVPSVVDRAALEAVARNPPSDIMAARDSLPPQILRLLVPPLRTCALFLVRRHVAVGWDVRTLAPAGAGVTTKDIRDVLLPLTAESVLNCAVRDRRATLGQARDPTTMERTLFRFLRLPPPRAFGALPIVVGADVVAVLYVDRDDGPLDDVSLDDVRRAGAALGDALAPLAAAGALFPGPELPPVRPQV